MRGGFSTSAFVCGLFLLAALTCCSGIGKVFPDGQSDVGGEAGECEPDCTGKKCGDDGCGGGCGECPAGSSCQDFQCVSEPCEPKCDGKECGDDGCGGICGNCPMAAPVCEGGKCQVEACVPACAGKECGNDGCSGTCGNCPMAAPVCEAGKCKPDECIPECAGKECGADGCSGNCGLCQTGSQCVNGACTDPVAETRCDQCSSDVDCGELDCFPLGGGTHCFEDCNSNDDCPTGWMCYALSNDGKQCIPLAFSCDADCLAESCPEGQVCNQETGQCQEGGGECAPCQQEWDCQEGFRCYQDGKYCAPVCGAGACPAASSCETVNAIPVNLCISDSPACCYGPECGGSCPDDKPHLCNDGECHECCTSAHCASFGEDVVCNDNVCKPGTGTGCDSSLCQDPYPACTQINGIPSCVQCTDDSYCPDGVCNVDLYACVPGPPEPGECGMCLFDADCLSSDGLPVECDPVAQCCYDPAGWCDGVKTFCNATFGSKCYGLEEILAGGSIPGMPDGPTTGLCSCLEPMDMMSLMMCLMGGCPSGGCYGEGVCVEPSILLDLLGGEGAIPPVIGLCVNLNSLLGGLLP